MKSLHDSALVSALLDAQHDKRAVKLYAETGALPFFGTLLGFDYYDSCLLIEGFKPPLSGSALESLKNSPFWIQMKQEQCFLNVQGLLQDHLHDLYTIKMIDYNFCISQRWFPRIHFAPRQGPTITLHIDSQIPIRAHIKNLSTHGAAIEIYGDDVRESLSATTRYDASIEFNDLFVLPLSVELKHVHFERTAPRRTEIRLCFCSLERTKAIQIENFIDAFEHLKTGLNTVANSNHAA